MDAKTEQRILDDIAAVRAAGRQIYAPTELGEAPLPSDVYADRARYEAEVREIFFRSWIPVARSSELGAPGGWLRRAVERAEVVITRDEDGALHAFHNTCLHRGAALVSADGCGQRLVCPYHAWSYGLDGALLSVPEPSAFPAGFEAKRLRLGPVAVDVAWGWIWVNLSPSPMPLATFLGPELLDELANFRLDALEVKFRIEREGEFDWKAAAENYLEPYHAAPVHPRSIHPLIHHKEAVMEWWNDHSRMAIPLRVPRLYEAESRVGDAPFAPMLPGLNGLQRTSTLVYMVWPSLVVNTMPNHVLVLQVLPAAPGRTRVLLEVLAEPGGSESAGLYFGRLREGYDAFLGEDFGVCTAVQRGLGGAFRPPLELCHYDRRIRHHRGRVEVWLGRR